jgi:hypothetical protein
MSTRLPDPRDGGDTFPDYGDGDSVFPFPQFGRVTFELSLPYSAQRDLLQRSPATHSERFRVETRYGYWSPVTTVIPLEPSSEPRPSDAVIVVRRFLERELGRQPESPITHQFLGPSPFHADFFLHVRPADVGEPPQYLRLDRVEARGYNELRFDFAAGADESPWDAFTVVLDDLRTELDLFYFVTWTNVERGRRWYDLADLQATIVDLEKATGVREAWRRFRQSGSLIHEAIVRAATYEHESLLTRKSIDAGCRDVYRVGESTFIRPDVEEAKEDRFVADTHSLIEPLKLLETRRLTSLELIAVILSAVVGGVVGALLTLAAH